MIRMLFDFEVVKYIDELIEKSSHIYVGNIQECRDTSLLFGRTVNRIVNLACELPFKTRHLLNIVQITFVDGYKESVLMYDDVLKVKYKYNIATGDVMFDVLETDDNDWQADLQVLYYGECREHDY